MMTFLVATDLSVAVDNAFSYAVLLAKKSHARIVLLHVMPGHRAAINATEANNSNEQISQVFDQLRALVTQVADSSLNITLAVQHGDVAHAIAGMAAKEAASFIVMGIKPENNLAKKLTGGHIQHVNKHSNVPVIAVPANAKQTLPSVLAFANAINLNTNLHLLDGLVDFGRAFNTTLKIVRVIKHSADEVVERLDRSEQLRHYLGALHPVFEFISSHKVAEGLHEFSQQNNVDMLVLLPKDHSLMEKLFAPGVSGEVSWHAHIPVMLLPMRRKDGCADGDTSCMQCDGCRLRNMKAVEELKDVV